MFESSFFSLQSAAAPISVRLRSRKTRPIDAIPAIPAIITHGDRAHISENMKLTSRKPRNDDFCEGFKHFLWNLAAIAVFWHKLTLILKLELLDFSRPASYLWLPSLFAADLFFLFVVHAAAFWMPSRRWLSLSITALIVTATSLATSFEIPVLILHHETIPWDLSIWAWTQRGHLHGMAESEFDDGSIKVWMVFLTQLAFAMLLTYFTKRSILGRIQNTTLVAKFRGRRTKMGLLIALFYSFMVLSLRPSFPYSKLSETPFFSVPFAILKSASEYSIFDHLHKRNLNAEDSNNQRAVAIAPQIPTNVVFIFLETGRADFLPFDDTTEWAERFVYPDKATRREVTPFYNEWIKMNTTMYIPLMKSASGYTHKSLLSAYCSAYAIPKHGTGEHIYSVYNRCLPQILGDLGYTSMHFQSTTSTFDEQIPLMQRLGFPTVFGKEQYDEVYEPDQKFRTRHTANYFGYEEDILLKPMFDWVDNQSQPFLLSYLTGITHHPHNMPPSKSWKPGNFSWEPKVNDMLNAISYTDRFLGKIKAEFDKRGLTESTLFVIMGDHGTDFLDHEKRPNNYKKCFEEIFNVGVTFHSENDRLTSRLRNNSHLNGNWSSLDVLPTVLDVLGLYNDTSLFDGRNDRSLVDGRSMLQASGRRLLLSLGRGGSEIVLRDWPYILIVPKNSREEQYTIFDMSKDPKQKEPFHFSDQNDYQSDVHVGDLEKLRWGLKGADFVRHLVDDLTESYQSGTRCSQCSLAALNSMESLDQWNEPSSTGTSNFKLRSSADVH